MAVPCCGGQSSGSAAPPSAPARPGSAPSFGEQEFGKGFSFFYSLIDLFSATDKTFLFSFSSRLNSRAYSLFFRPWERRYLGSAMTLQPSPGRGVGVGSEALEAQLSLSGPPVSFTRLGSSTAGVLRRAPCCSSCIAFNYFQHVLIGPDSDNGIIKETSLSAARFRTRLSYHIPEALGQAAPENAAKTSFCSELHCEGHQKSAPGQK